MPNQPPLNPDAVSSIADVILRHCGGYIDTTRADAERAANAVLRSLAVAQPVVNSVEAFINQRPEYITALKNTRGTDDQADYHRWQGGAEARRQLAQALGWTVPHNPGETTRPEVDDA